MSSKLNLRSSKQSRPKSSDKAKTGKKGGGTPEKSATPNQSSEAIGDEGSPQSQNVIMGEDIAKLAIRDEDLQQLRTPKPPSEEKQKPSVKLIVRKLKPAEELEQPRPQKVTVFKPAPPSAPLRPMDYSGFIDLSPKRPTTEEASACKDKYHKTKMVMNILRHTALLLHLTQQQQHDLLYNTAWKIDREFNAQGQPHHIFQQAISDPSVLDICDIDERCKEVLLHVIRLKLHISPPVVCLRSLIQVTCFYHEGIDAVKAALLAAKSVPTSTAGEFTLKIRVVSSPEYELSLKTSDEETGRAVIRTAQCLIQNRIEQSKGEFKVIKEICVRDHGYWETTYRG